MKYVSDGGESNPVQVAGDLFTFWKFPPKQQQEG
jgi:hypothetical protein